MQPRHDATSIANSERSRRTSLRIYCASKLHRFSHCPTSQAAQRVHPISQQAPTRTPDSDHSRLISTQGYINVGAILKPSRSALHGIKLLVDPDQRKPGTLDGRGPGESSSSSARHRAILERPSTYQPQRHYRGFVRARSLEALSRSSYAAPRSLSNPRRRQTRSRSISSFCRIPRMLGPSATNSSSASRAASSRSGGFGHQLGQRPEPHPALLVRVSPTVGHLNVACDQGAYAHLDHNVQKHSGRSPPLMLEPARPQP